MGVGVGEESKEMWIKIFQGVSTLPPAAPRQQQHTFNLVYRL